ncbi:MULTISPECIES: NIPSNAP family protein [unclassified Mesorhizobium]|uniref:NIPSNAP family protein n=1 Tax=unclassified Mesorhizobium TaxID=325217 RepID=UPI000B2E4EFD|nr:NIPSNAP family protein [Mesorhizobium sp. Root1471]
MMLYELATLSGPLLRLDELSDAARSWVDDADAAGRLLGMWRSDIGTLGQVFVLRGFEIEEDQRRERQRALFSTNPFNANAVCTALSMETYAPFPFLPPVRPRSYGGLFEFRTYHLKPGGLPATLAGWKDVIEPAKRYTDHLVVNMYALDGPPRITHIWGFSSLDERRTLRAEHYAARLWPPKGGPEQIASASSTIAIAERDSPLG